MLMVDSLVMFYVSLYNALTVSIYKRITEISPVHQLLIWRLFYQLSLLEEYALVRLESF